MKASLSGETDLVIVLPHLGPGGAQKVAILAAQHFQSQGVRVAIVTLLPGKTLAHHLPAEIPWFDLGPAVAATWSDRALQARFSRFLRAWTHRLMSWCVLTGGWPWIEQIAPPGHVGLVQWLVAGVSGAQATLLANLLASTRPRCVLSLLTRTNLLCCQAVWDLPCRLVVSERNDPRLQTQPFPWPRLQHWLWRRADVITANTAGVLEGLRRLHPDRASAMHLLPNPLPLQSIKPGSDCRNGTPTSQRLLAVCRLVPQKGIDLLIRAYSQLNADLRQQWPLQIAGDGPERRALEDLSVECGTAADISFLGFVRDPWELYRPGDVFILPSRFEGMPNALLEAMSRGMAVVVSDASPGPLEVVQHDVTGLVVPRENIKALYVAISRLIAERGLREELGTRAALKVAAHDWSQLDSLWRRTLDLAPAPGTIEQV